MKEFARRRLEKAAEFIEAARLGEGFEDSAADRSYYAMFYAVEALLADGVDLNGGSDPASAAMLIDQADKLVSAIRRYLAPES